LCSLTHAQRWSNDKQSEYYRCHGCGLSEMGAESGWGLHMPGNLGGVLV